MILAIRILLLLTMLICFFGGANLLLKGAVSFLPKTLPTNRVLDDVVRFLSGIYFGLSFLLGWVIVNLEAVHGLVYFIGIVIIFSGLGRLYSRIKVGSAGRYFDIVMIAEVILGAVLILLNFLVA